MWESIPLYATTVHQYGNNRNKFFDIYTKMENVRKKPDISLNAKGIRKKRPKPLSSLLLRFLKEMVIDIGEDLAALLRIDEPFGIDRVAAHRRIDDIERAEMIAEPLLRI